MVDQRTAPDGFRQIAKVARRESAPQIFNLVWTRCSARVMSHFVVLLLVTLARPNFLLIVDIVLYSTSGMYVLPAVFVLYVDKRYVSYATE